MQGDAPTDPKLANGYFVPPTIFADVDNDARIAREEIFGPVMSVIPFTSTDEVVGSRTTTNMAWPPRCGRVTSRRRLNTAKALRAGIVWINDSQPAPTETPWGGYKQSGIGRELGREGLDDYLEAKHIYVNLVE